MDCGVNTMARFEYYLLRDPVWRLVNPLEIGMLCLECAEERLGRPLHRGDVSAAPVNRMFASRCSELNDRLVRIRPKKTGGLNKGHASAVHALLARKQRTQSKLGRLSATLLLHRSPTGRVPRDVLVRVLNEQMQSEPSSDGPVSLEARSAVRRKRVDRGR